MPDTYNAPGYPYLLAAWFKVIKPQFVQTRDEISARHMYSGDRWIPEFNQIFVFLTGLLIFILGLRLFDERVAWISCVAFVLSDTVWRYSVTGLSTCLLMCLVTAALICAIEIFSVSERVAERLKEGEEASLAPAWWWAVLLGLSLAAACLTRLHLLILVAPLLVFFIVLPRTHAALFPLVALLVVGLVGPWFWHTYLVCGNPLGSNLPLLLYGEDKDYKGNQIYCTTAIPSYDQLFKDAASKEYTGFLWHFEHGWDLLGSSPMIVLAITSILHQFKRQRVRAFQWLVIGCALSLVAANNLCSAEPEAVGPWNVLILLLPAMLVVGTAYFFVLLDRLNLHVPLLGTVIVVTVMALTFLPMSNTLTTPNFNFYNFPPYAPNYINMIGRFAAPDEWVTSDMPWATAWYADRASLWLPDSISDFETLHDDVCPTGVLLLTPVTLNQTATALRSGELREWYSLLILNNIPTDFPLSAHVMTEPGGPDYSIWSDRARWKAAGAAH